ncbi:patatin-like phospholipase family protein, partial [bacterium]|nr:patatin-like phospholipase family protein [bacterium]
ALFPLLDHHPDADLVLVSVTPFACPELPRRSDNIAARLGQITMNAALIRELQDIRTGRVANGRVVRLHHIQADDAMRDLGHYSKLVTDGAFLAWLKDVGRNAAEQWLNRNFDAVGGQAAPSSFGRVGSIRWPREFAG